MNVQKAIKRERIPATLYDISMYSLVPLVLILAGGILAFYTYTHDWSQALKDKNYLPIIGLGALALLLLIIGIRLLFRIGKIFKLTMAPSEWSVPVKDAFLSSDIYAEKQLKLTPTGKPQVGEYHFTYRRNFATILYNVIILTDEAGFYINVRHPNYKHTSAANLKIANRLKTNLMEILGRVQVTDFGMAHTAVKPADALPDTNTIGKIINTQ